MERKKSEAADRIGFGTITQVSFVVCSILLFAGIASADTAGYAGYEQRKQRVIDLLAGKPIREDDPTFDSYEVEAMLSLARLAKGTDLEAANKYFADWGPTHDPSQYNDNFTYTYWIRAYFMYKGTDRLTAAAKSRMLTKIGQEWRNYSPHGSENHTMCHASNIYLARQFYGDDLSTMRSWLIDRFVDRAKTGWHEFNSSYEAVSMWGIWNLADFAEDPVIKKLATMTLDWLLAEYAVENLNMYRGGPFHRNYTTAWDDQYAMDIGANYIFFGNYVVPGTPAALHAALSDYRAPKVVVDIAIDRDEKGSYVLKARRPKGNLYYYVTPAFVLACAQNGGSLGKIGIGGVEKVRYGDQRWDLSFGTGPRAVIHSDSEGKPSQYKNLLVIDTQGKPLKYAVLLGRDFDINETEGQWRFIKEGGAYAAIHCQGSLYLFEVRLASDYDSFADFKKDIKDSPLRGSDPCTYTSTLEDTVEFTDRIIKVNGRSYDTSDYKLFDSPFVNSEWDSGYVVIRKGGRKLILDFRDPENPQTIQTRSGTLGWNLRDFKGKQMDYANWLRHGDGPRGYHTGTSQYDGEYHVNDEDGKVRGLVNNALLYLAFGQSEPAWKDNSANRGAFIRMTAKKAYHNQFMWLYNARYGWPDNGDRQLADAVESYVYMRDAGVFNLEEQRKLEDWFSGLTPDSSRQFVKEGWYALLGYVLDTTKTGKDYSSIVANKWNIAKRRLYFNQTFGPIENSAHYNAYIFKSMLRITLYIDGRGGKKKNIPASEKVNIKKTVEWILDIFPHNGYGLSFGNEWFDEQVRGLHDFLLGASYVLNDGVSENIKTARKAKWMATRMFRYLFHHHSAADYFNKPPRYECNPMWAWRYCNDSLPELEPTLSEHGSKKVYGEMGNSYSSSNPHVLKLDKVVHRDGWGPNSFYLYLDMAPSSGKNAPYANAIWNVVHGDEPFCPGHKREQGNAGNQRTWEELNVIIPHKGNKVDGECIFLNDFASYSASKTREGTWDRYVGFPKDNSYAVVFDFAPSAGKAYWHFLSNPAPSRDTDSVKLSRRNHQLQVYYPNNYSWYSITHHDRHTWNEKDGRKRIWVVDDPSRELQLSGAKTWGTVLHPDRGTLPTSVTAINPDSGYPNAIGVKLVYSNYTDWNGARHVSGAFTYDQVTTDAEIFWAREDSAKWTISFVNGKQVNISLAAPPAKVTFNDSEIRRWRYSQRILIVTPDDTKGTMEVTK